MRWTKCPQCDSQMHQRKLPLIIHVDPMQMLSLNKTCRYCPHCDLLIAHQDDVEHFLATFFGEQKPEVVGNDYLVLGTLDKPIWKQGTQQQMTLQEMLEACRRQRVILLTRSCGLCSIKNTAGAEAYALAPASYLADL